MRIKHKVLNPIASRLPDTTRCPICRSDFHSRMRLVAHLSDTRVRSRVRGTNCHSVFMASHDVLPTSFLDSGLNAALGESRRRARAVGSTHEKATLRCASGRPSVLKGLTPTLQQRGLPNRRISVKSTVASLRAKSARVSTIVPQTQIHFASENVPWYGPSMSRLPCRRKICCKDSGVANKVRRLAG